MNPTRQLHDLGQSLWLDNITRELLNQGTLRHYMTEFSISGLTSNPTIFEQAISASAAYDAGICEKWHRGKSAEEVFIELALEDLGRAADIFRPIFEATAERDGWVSMEISPLLAADALGSIDAARRIYAQADRRNLFVKIPGTPAGLVAIEECIFLGIPINVTLLFSREHYLAAAEAYMRGIERRVETGLSPDVASVASLFVSRWDKAVSDSVPDALRNRLGIVIARRTYHAWLQLLASTRWKRLAQAGARPQRLLWASTGSKDPQASDTLYVEALAAPDTINTLPPKTLLAFADHGALSGTLPDDGDDAEAVLVRFTEAGVDIDTLALQLQEEGTQAFIESWQKLLQRIAEKGAALATGSGK